MSPHPSGRSAVYACEHCGKIFPSKQSRHHHRMDAHQRKRKPQPTREQTIADMEIDALLDEAMGIYNPDQEWLS